MKLTDLSLPHGRRACRRVDQLCPIHDGPPITSDAEHDGGQLVAGLDFGGLTTLAGQLDIFGQEHQR